MEPIDIKTEWEKCDVAGMPGVSDSIKEILRAIELFQAKKDIVVCVGMLKSGKSTLINLLARNKEASPTEQGVDKTLRPVLFRMANEGQDGIIRIYYQQDKSHNRRTAFKSIIDYMCGIKGALPEQQVKEKQEKFVPQHLEEILCRKFNDTKYLDAEPLLVVVDLPHDEDSAFFRGNDRMLMDMPGCDSGKAESSQNGDYAIIGAECAMVLLLQTNMNPLNRHAMDQLKEILAGRNEKTVRLILNRMDNKTWRKGDTVQKDNTDQLADACRQIKEIYPTSEPKYSKANLAMAIDAMFADEKTIQERCKIYEIEYEGKASLWKGSQFPDLEEELISSLSSIRGTHCWDRLKSSLKDMENECDSKLAETKNNIKEKDDKRAKWKEVYDTIMNHFKNQYGEDNRIYNVKDKPDFEKICEREWRNDKNIKTGENMETEGADIDKCMNKCNEECYEKYTEIKHKALKLSNIEVREKEGGGRTLQNVANDQLNAILGKLTNVLTRKYSEQWKEVNEEKTPKQVNWEDESLCLYNKQEKPEDEKYVIQKRFVGRVKKFVIFTCSKTYEINSNNPVFQGPVITPMCGYYKDKLDRLDWCDARKNLKKLMEKKYNEAVSEMLSHIQEDHVKRLNDEIAELEQKIEKLQKLQDLAKKQHEDISKQVKQD